MILGQSLLEYLCSQSVREGERETCMNAHAQVCAHKHAHTHTHMRARAHTHTRTNTHTQENSISRL